MLIIPYESPVVNIYLVGDNCSSEKTPLGFRAVFLFQYFLYPQHLAVLHKIRSDKHGKGDVEDDEGHVSDGVESDDVSSGQTG